MTGKRELAESHRPYMSYSPATVHCTGCTLVFDSWEKFGKHVDDLLAQPPHSREDAVEDVLADHLGNFGSDNQLDPYVGGNGRVRCGCGWVGAGPDEGELYRHLTGTILTALEAVK